MADNKISIYNALIISISLLILSILIGFTINVEVIYLLLIYFISSLFYSKFLKKIIYFDCIILSGFYLYRMFFGCNIIEIKFSSWLIFFSFCLFFSLALLKRYNELEILKINKILKNYKRNYSYKRDVKLLKNIGLFSGLLSCFILISYSQSLTASEYYNSPNLIILSGIMLIFWIVRIWKKAKIVNMNDPVEFALKDIFTYFVFLLIVLIFIFSKINIF